MKSPDAFRSSRNRGPEAVRLARTAVADGPPRMPEGPERERAITLLGNRARSELSAKARAELERLVGAYPTAEQAGRWKTGLKRHDR
jgi:hypothetical protein